MMRIVAATIGRNVGDTPMNFVQWEKFKYELRQVMRQFSNRDTEFEQEFSGTGIWGGISEENYRFEMYFSEESTETVDVGELKSTLETLAWLYQQDGIALIMGSSEVV